MDALIAGRYRLIKPLGQGGMAEVFLAEQSGPRGFSRQVVLKRMRAHLSEDESFVRNFEDEARLAALLQHPNIVRTEDFGDHEGQLFMVLEHVQGDELSRLAKMTHGQDQALPLRLILQIGVDIADALDHAHKQHDAQGKPLEVVHRDVSPQNLMVTQEGQGKLLDFGIARASTNQEQTEAGKVKGKVAYFSPEQATGGELDGRCDQFALAVVLFELLIRHRLFLDHNLIGTLRRVVRCDVPALTDFRQDLSAELQHTLRRALSRELSQRFPDCATFAEALNRCLDACGGRMDARRYKRWRTAIPDGRLTGFAPLAFIKQTTTANSEQSTLMIGGETVLGHKNLGIAADEPTELDLATQSTVIETSWSQTNIDLPLDTFVGRVTEMATIKATLKDGKRLITLLGAGGSGKTRLALQFGAQCLSQFMGGVWFCDLSESLNEDDIIEAMASSLGLKLGSGDRRAQISQSLAGRDSVLLIIDNVEQVAKEVPALLQTWANQAPKAAFLVTSRARLQIAGETVLAVDPLALPDAMQLFIDRAQAVAPSFEVDDSNEALIKEIVERLDCMSLAVELAAARVRMMTPAMIHQRLAQRFKLLRGQRSNQTARQATLLGAVEWSWNLLDEAQQSTLCQVAIFHGGFTLEAVESIIDLSNCAGEPWVLDTLAALVDQSLVRHQSDADGTGRYRLLETIRAFGLSQLGDKVEPVTKRHADYFAGQGDPNLPLRYQANVVAWPPSERDNLRAAFEHAHDQSLVPQALAIGWQRLAALEWEQSHFGPTIRQLLERMLALAPADELAAGFILTQATFRAEPGFAERAQTIHDHYPHPLLAFRIAEFSVRQLVFKGDYQTALGALKHTHNLPLTAGQKEQLLTHETRIHRLTSDFPKALACLDQIAAIQPKLTFDQQRTRGAIFASQGRLQDARDTFNRIQAVSKDERMITQAEFGNEAAWVEAFFDSSEAERMARRAYKLARRAGSLNAQAQALINRATNEWLRGNLSPVAALVRQALARYDQERGPSYQWTAAKAGGLLVETGDHDEALTLLTNAVTAYEGVSDDLLGDALSARAVCHCARGNTQAGLADYEATLNLRVHGPTRVFMLRQGMRVYHALGQLNKAHNQAQHAAALAKTLGCGGGTALYDCLTRLCTELELEPTAP